jgi:hypothetical protein
MRRRPIEPFQFRQHCYHTCGLVQLLVISAASDPVSDRRSVVEMLTPSILQYVKLYVDQRYRTLRWRTECIPRHSECGQRCTVSSVLYSGLR